VLGDLIGDVLPGARRFDARRSTVVDALRPGLLPAPAPDPVAPDGRDPLGHKLLLDFARDLLPGFLHYGDAISMAHGVESRLPYLDHRLVELCFRMPSAHKVRDGRTKAVLRAYLHRAGHERVAECRRKRGYPTPTSGWLARDGGAVLREHLLDPGARTRDYVDPGALERLIERHAGGMLAAGDVLFGLLCTEIWLQECVSLGA
jgi:asparagine synthase (glutamine-hydrolysing)